LVATVEVCPKTGRAGLWNPYERVLSGECLVVGTMRDHDNGSDADAGAVYSFQTANIPH
jgi:hypothetical protein